MAWPSWSFAFWLAISLLLSIAIENGPTIEPTGASVHCSITTQATNKQIRVSLVSNNQSTCTFFQYRVNILILVDLYGGGQADIIQYYIWAKTLWVPRPYYAGVKLNKESNVRHTARQAPFATWHNQIYFDFEEGEWFLHVRIQVRQKGVVVLWVVVADCDATSYAIGRSVAHSSLSVWNYGSMIHAEF